MKAHEKFEARLHELGLYNEWLEQGALGRIGIELEKEDKIIILVHECDDDAYTEFTYPPMSEMEQDEDFRRRALAEFVDAGDETFVRNLIRWYINRHNKCPLFPVDVYFLWENHTYTDFEDDVEEPAEQETSMWNFREITNEWCPYCDTEVELEYDLKVQMCPSCGKWITPCSVCPLTKCIKPCPLVMFERLLNGETF